MISLSNFNFEHMNNHFYYQLLLLLTNKRMNHLKFMQKITKTPSKNKAFLTNQKAFLAYSISKINNDFQVETLKMEKYPHPKIPKFILK